MWIQPKISNVIRSIIEITWCTNKVTQPLSLLWTAAIHRLPYWHGHSGWCRVVTFWSRPVKLYLQLSYCSYGLINRHLRVIQYGSIIDWYFQARTGDASNNGVFTLIGYTKKWSFRVAKFAVFPYFCNSVIRNASPCCQCHPNLPELSHNFRMSNFWN